MENKIYLEGKWIHIMERGGFFYRKAGYYDPGEYSPLEEQLFISEEQVRQLIPVLDESGYIVPRLDERLRAEDLKITHRLLDVIEKQIK